MIGWPSAGLGGTPLAASRYQLQRRRTGTCAVPRANLDRGDDQGEHHDDARRDGGVALGRQSASLLHGIHAAEVRKDAKVAFP